MKLVAARHLRPGSRVRTGDGFGVIETVEYDPDHLIIGGPDKKLAAAMKVTVRGGAVYHVHPGSTIFTDQET
jgi:hypothetical protein